MIEKIKQTADYIRSKAGNVPETAIILGTGLGALVDHITEKKYIPYTEIPNFPVSTVEGHSGNLIFGRLGNRQVIAMQGRFHYYEGYDMKEVTFPVRVMKQLGVKTLFVSNAAGGMNKEFRVGDIMIITDHISIRFKAFTPAAAPALFRFKAFAPSAFCFLPGGNNLSVYQ